MNGFDVVRGGTGGGVFLYATRHDEPSGRVELFCESWIQEAGLISQASTGLAPAQPCPGRTGVSKGAAPHLGPHPGEADCLEPVELAVSQTARRPGQRATACLQPGASPHRALLGPNPSQASRTRVGASGEEVCSPPGEASSAWVPQGPPQPGLGLKGLLPALPFSFTLVSNSKVKLKTEKAGES